MASDTFCVCLLHKKYTNDPGVPIALPDFIEGFGFMKKTPTFFTLLFLATALTYACFAAPQIKELDAATLALADGNPVRFSIMAKGYEAAVHRDGRVSVSVDGEKLFDGCWLMQNGRLLELGKVSRDGDSAVFEVREGKAETGDIDDLLGKGGGLGGMDVDLGGGLPSVELEKPDLAGLRFEFKDDSVSITFVDSEKAMKDPKKAPSYTLGLGLGSDAVGVVNLRRGVEEALPAYRTASSHEFSFGGRLGNFWPDLRIMGAKGTAFEIRGIDGVAPAGASQLKAVPDGDRKALRSGAMMWNNAKAGDKVAMSFPAETAKKSGKELARVPPINYAAAGKNGLFAHDEPVRFKLEFDDSYDAAGKYLIEWKTVDHIQKPLGEGKAEFEIAPGTNETTVDIVAVDGPMGYGYTEAWVSRVDRPSVKRYLTFEYGRMRFEHDFRNEKDSYSTEFYWMNQLGFRGVRHNDSVESIWTRHKDADNPENINWESYRAELAQNTDFAKRGTLRTIVVLMEGSGGDKVDEFFKKNHGADGGSWKDARAEAKARWLKEWARVAGSLGVHVWEPTNEPDLGMSQQAYLDKLLKPIYGNIKAGDPEANFLGGSSCGLEKHSWVRKLYEIDGDEYFDGLSFHPYTGAGFQRVYRMHIGKWFDLFKDFNDDPSQGIYMTEAANHRGWGYNDYVYDSHKARRESHAHTGLHMLLNAEAMGIPRDHNYIFYASEHGYNDFFLLRRASPTPSAIAFQVMNECLRDARFVREFPLPGPDHYFQLYRDEERTAAALFTGGDVLAIDVLTDAPSVELTDCMGNRSTLVAKNGRVGVEFDNFPIYLKVAPGQSLAPAYDGGIMKTAPNLALAALGASVEVSTPQGDPKATPPEVMIDGDWTAYANGRWVEDESGTNSYPDTIEVKLPEPASIGSVMLHHEYGGWQRTLRDFDIEVFAGGKWQVVDSTRGNYYAEATRHVFAPVTTDRVRVVVHAVNQCLFGEVRWIKPLSSLRNIAVYSAPSADAKVFFGEVRLDKPDVVQGGSFKLPYRLVNPGATPFKGELRFVAAAGLSAKTLPVEIPAGGETTVDVEIAADTQAEKGVKTIVAGVYSDGNLVSTDYSPRWASVK